MSLPALALLFLAAAFHTGWNLLLKQAGDKYIALWWAGMLTAGLALPVLLLGGAPGLEIWPFIFLSALTEVLYIATLAYAYELSDFSLIYPIARGAAPAFLAFWASLFLGDRLNLVGASGLVILIGGLLVVGSSNWLGKIQPHSDSLPGKSIKAHWQSVGLALLVALLISVYSTIDGAAVQRTPATPYTIMVIGLTGPLFTPFMLRRHSWANAVQVWRGQWPRIVLIAALSLLAYALVLNAYTIAPVSYAGAIREVSVVFAAFAGWRLLGEKLGLVRVFGSLMIFAGVVLISLA